MEETFKFLNKDDVRLLRAKMRLALARPGQKLVMEGRQPIGIFVIRKGMAEVRRTAGTHEMVAAELGPGEIFGESAFLQQIPANASVIARDALDVMIFTPDRLNPLFEEHPGLFGRFFQSVALIVCRRLRAYTAQTGDKPHDPHGDLPSWEIL